MRCVALWLVFVAWSSCAGWLLSAIGILNVMGYTCALVPLIIACVSVWRSMSPAFKTVTRLKNPFRNCGSQAWSIVTLLSLLAGLLFAPSNYDALSYRLPRILYWWQENRWHWLEHADQRMNYSGTGFEWQMLPMLVFTGSDRLLFFLNWIPFLFFPALVFISLRYLGVRKRTSARWMWILPLCYGYALQSSSIGNDALGGVFVLAAVTFCAIAVENKSLLALALAAIAAAALSGIKFSNLPLLLPIAVFWLTSAWRIRDKINNKKVVAYALPILAVLVLTSFVPSACLNHKYCGNWSGDPTDSDRLRITKSLPGATGNIFNLTTGSLQLPILPIPSSIKNKLLEPIIGSNSLTAYIQTGFTRFIPDFGGEIPIEEAAGVGLGVTLVLIIPLLLHRSRMSRSERFDPWACISIWIAFISYLVSLGSENTARLMLPYYPLIIASLLTLFNWNCVSRRCMILYSWIPFFCILPSLLINPNRPLIPLARLAEFPGLSSELKTRLSKLDEAYGSRSDPLHEIRDDLPENCQILGFAGGPTESSYSLFKPYGSRKIVEVHKENVDDFEWIVAASDGIRDRTGKNWEQWIEMSSYSIASRYHIAFKASVGAKDWYLLHRSRSVGYSPDTRSKY